MAYSSAYAHQGCPCAAGPYRPHPQGAHQGAPTCHVVGAGLVPALGTHQGCPYAAGPYRPHHLGSSHRVFPRPPQKFSLGAEPHKR